MTSVIESPCVSVCALDENDVCIGCHRHGLEISYWGRLSSEQQQNVLNTCERRSQGEVIASTVTHRSVAKA